MFERKVIVILGPTASGKSVLGVHLAKKFNGVVISADSRQVYRGLNIGTAKITKREMLGVPHYLLSVVSPRTQYSVARYVRDVGRVLRTIPITTPIFLVGGSPFYIDAITKPNTFSPVPPNPVLRRRLAGETSARLFARLRKLDRVRAQNIDPANRRRLIRAIEIAKHTPLPEVADVPKPLWRRHEGHAGGVGVLPPMCIVKLGLRVSRPELYRRIDQRVDSRLLKLIAEVKQLHHQGLSWKRLDSFGLEYRFASQFLQHKITKRQMADSIKFGSHAFVRRQMTWWKRDTAILWITKTSVAGVLVKKFLS